MMNAAVLDNKQAIQLLHQSPHAFVLAVTGGGSSAIAQLLAIPGASNTILQCLVPYSAAALADFLGNTPQSACSLNTARLMAMTAFESAKLLNPDKPSFGLGCTAAISTHRDRKGQDQCFVSIQSEQSTLLLELMLDKKHSRDYQERQCCALILYGMLLSTGLTNKRNWDGLVLNHFVAPRIWQDLLQGDASSTLSLETRSLETRPRSIFPGAFNPPHSGHREIVRLAEEKLGHEVFYEISISNVDKAKIDFIDMKQRQDSLEGANLIFTNAPTFIDKSTLFPGSTFIVGVDTICRIADVIYYENSTKKRDDAIANFIKNNNRFLVFGRLIGENYLTLSKVQLPEPLLKICDEITEDEFREDYSSSDIRLEAAM
ncbi:MAG: nicotinamide mononucleotide (NMN) deamidase PncC [Flavobacterium sp.]|jgi:nicotinamide mononucleotide (NMN) deamidase PncC